MATEVIVIRATEVIVMEVMATGAMAIEEMVTVTLPSNFKVWK